MSRELASKFRRGLRAPLAIAALVTATAIPLTANAASSITLSPQCTATHRVLNNDSWTRLAARFKVPQARLLRMNGATFTTPLFVGNKVCISTRSTSPSGVTAPLPSTPIAAPAVAVPSVAVPSVAVPTAAIVTVAEPVACQQIQVSWRGASPDTGYYSLQWVRVSASGSYDFSTYTMLNVRGTSTALPVWLNHGKTYALRVFAMRADWEGIWHSNQNVTPHSAIVTFTVPTCGTSGDVSAYSVTYSGNTNESGSVPVDAASYSSGATVTVSGNTGTLTKFGYAFDGWCTTQPVAGASCGATARAASSSFAISSNVTLYAVWSPLTCANGGFCAVGDTGPGGGVVFYVHDDADDMFTSSGSDCGSSCRYLEAASSDSSAGIVLAMPVYACFFEGSDVGDQRCTGWSMYSNSENQSTSRSTSELFGQGMANTNKIYARVTTAGGASTSEYAAGLAWSYTSNGKSDWHLPSKQELNELCKYARHQSTGNTSVSCTSSVSRRSGFRDDYYWSSSEEYVSSAANRIAMDFTDGFAQALSGSSLFRVRIIRALG